MAEQVVHASVEAQLLHVLITTKRNCYMLRPVVSQVVLAHVKLVQGNLGFSTAIVTFLITEALQMWHVVACLHSHRRPSLVLSLVAVHGCCFCGTVAHLAGSYQPVSR